MLAIDFDIGDIVFEDSGDVDLYILNFISPVIFKPAGLYWKHIDWRWALILSCRGVKCRAELRTVKIWSLTSGNVPLEKTLDSEQ